MVQRMTIFLIACYLLGLPGCHEGQPTHQVGHAERLRATLPSYFPDSVPSPSRNQLTPEGVALGRRLFFDPILSGSNRISCASCHPPEKAFADGLPTSTLGETGEPLKRNTPTLLNVAWETNGLFWDGGAHDLESQAFAPLTHPDEMGQDLAQLLAELRSHEEYPGLFRAAFGVDTLQTAHVVRALAQFQRTLFAANARYDSVRLGEAAFRPEEAAGARLFERHCSRCHTPPLFTDHGFHNNGLDSTFPMDFENEAQGRYRITLSAQDLGKFKTPTLRNVARTAPYMHDGRFRHLATVMAHYAGEKAPSPTLDAGLDTLRLTEQEQQQLIAFLQTLSGQHDFGPLAK